MPYNEYVQATEFHYNLQGLISNLCFKYDNNNIQDTFISHLNHSNNSEGSEPRPRIFSENC